VRDLEQAVALAEVVRLPDPPLGHADLATVRAEHAGQTPD
jgi:hypothetical protein